MAAEFDEREEGTTCVDCGALIWGGGNRGYAYGPTNVLCFECAEARGGIYDEATDRWIVAPSQAS